jgi:hypothetical protein
MAAFLNKNSICHMHMLTPFCIKTNLRENRFFAARWTIGGKKDTHRVKILAEKFTTIEGLTSG